VPVPLTLGLFDDAVITDPALLEESLLTTQLTIVQTADRQLCAVHKPGGACVPAAQLAQCLALSHSHTLAVLQTLQPPLGTAAAAAAGPS
jgi:exosome complex RNA-binding protein Rrp42 (RNase PH superfamily)